ncbi:hypothetical protein G6O69_32460 [Pseudenhygromyxa sp. WMMC2535]|uniref:hypothetical protein n=1 Tax=Pseudenhygromyxa sp. WMMC2535 TaxID=2712867 RepID=UPI001595D02D|nr:hypothetical protein [Pseudenhygromyxa sp. WMMC2535]NVB42582.1 hypothetical protein [Pseudenhygromyxa sp. WMMC2535]
MRRSIVGRGARRGQPAARADLEAGQDREQPKMKASAPSSASLAVIEDRLVMLDFARAPGARVFRP